MQILQLAVKNNKAYLYPSFWFDECRIRIDVTVVFFPEFSSTQGTIVYLHMWLERVWSHLTPQLQASAKQALGSMTWIAVFHMQMSWSDINDETGILNKISIFNLIWLCSAFAVKIDGNRNLLQSDTTIFFFKYSSVKLSGHSDRHVKSIC